MKMLDPASTALVLIDLQKGIVAGNWAPRNSTEILATSAALADQFRANGATVVLVHVDFGPSLSLAPSQNVDRPFSVPAGGLPPVFSELVDGLRQPGDVVVLKRHWGAFTGTALDQELRRRGVKTIVLAGIATNFGVESTARSAWELGYDVVIVEDACASITAELHDFSISHILPHIARILPSESLLD